jgi:hypothetical protein
MEAIYLLYSRRGTSFEMTLSLLQDLMNRRLSPNYRRVWVQASNSGRVKFCFTVFPNRGEYRMVFLESGSFRQFRADGNLEEESRLIEDFITSLSEVTLNGVII